MKNRKIFSLAVLSIALVFSLILPAPAVGASVTVSPLGDPSIGHSAADGSRLAFTMAPNKPQEQVTPMVAVGAEAQNDERTLADAAVQYTLTLSSTEGGSVITPGEGTFTYNAGTVVNIAVKADKGYSFDGWTGDIATLECQCHSTTVTMNGNYVITANFNATKMCFIATAAYGTPMAEEVEILREFRDKYLVTNQLGRAFIDFYYKVSPAIAEFITEHPVLKPIVRAGLVPAVVMSIIAVNTTAAEKMAIAWLLVLVSAALAVWAMRRRGRGPEHTRG
jgi:uncharacterized repeat protein (TIGR02543 family)